LPWKITGSLSPSYISTALIKINRSIGIAGIRLTFDAATTMKQRSDVTLDCANTNQLVAYEVCIM
jgi:hypothetical protein